MRVFLTIFLFLALSVTAPAQVIFKTIVQKPVVLVNDAFFVQYTLEETGKDDGFSYPGFEKLTVVRGAEVNTGRINTSEGVTEVRTYTFTLVATKPGFYKIPGAVARVNGHTIKSDDVMIEAVERIIPENASTYFLQPGEDPQQKLRENLFLKVSVDKKTCFVGEPVVATFKLYSRLQSRSDIVKNPGFYGFTVHDMINLDDPVKTTENINGKSFVVHTIRAVQLYPLQAGLFRIDPMEVINTVDFSTSTVNQPAEQEIYEGVHDEEKKPANKNTISYKNQLNTEAIEIKVKPYPELNRPAIFNSATGNFTISAHLEKNELARNEEGDLIITISGKGNFTQITAPQVKWPTGIEAFDATVKDTLKKEMSPLTGTRTFRFPFVSQQPGAYQFPSIDFSFFDADKKTYKSISASVSKLVVTGELKKPNVSHENKREKPFNPVPWFIAGIVVLVVAGNAWWMIKYKEVPVKDLPVTQSEPVINAEEALIPVFAAMEKQDREFYTLLQKTIWDLSGRALHLTGSSMNKFELKRVLEEKFQPPSPALDIPALLELCEAAAYTQAEFLYDRPSVLERTKKALEALGG